MNKASGFSGFDTYIITRSWFSSVVTKAIGNLFELWKSWKNIRFGQTDKFTTHKEPFGYFIKMFFFRCIPHSSVSLKASVRFLAVNSILSRGHGGDRPQAPQPYKRVASLFVRAKTSSHINCVVNN